MSDGDLRNLYRGMIEGRSSSKPPQLSDMYKSVLIKEASDLVSTNNGDQACGNTETTIKYKDPATKEWRCARASDKWIEDILKPNLGIADSASYLDRILKHGTTTGVFDDSMSISHPSVIAFYEWLNSSVSRGTLAQVINQLPSVTIQNAIIDKFQDVNVTIFNYYDVLNDTINKNVSGAQARFQEDPKLTIIRPAGDVGATRGAAGPGEALLAFMYNGSKPTVGDLVFHEVDRKGEHTNRVRYVVELKKNKGRIGKGINKKAVKGLDELFHGFGAPGHGMDKRVGREHQVVRRGVAGTLKGLTYDDSGAGDEGLDPDVVGTLGVDFSAQWKNKSMYDFLNHFCGITHSKVDEMDEAFFSQGDYADCVTWFSKNIRMAKGVGENSTYNQIVQWIGGIHIKDYFKQVADFDSIAVFLQNGTIASFPKTTILTLHAQGIGELLSSKGCYFGKRTDEGGYDIQIRGATAKDTEG
jgi:hypothetical protein